MIRQRLYLKDRVDPTSAVQTLRTLIIEGRNLPSSGPDVAGFRDRYLIWVEGASYNSTTLRLTRRAFHASDRKLLANPTA